MGECVWNGVTWVEVDNTPKKPEKQEVKKQSVVKEVPKKSAKKARKGKR